LEKINDELLFFMQFITKHSIIAYQMSDVNLYFQKIKIIPKKKNREIAIFTIFFQILIFSYQKKKKKKYS